MRHLTALVPLVLFAILDLVMIVSCLVIIGVILIDESVPEFPLSYNFAKKIWMTG